MLVYPVEVNAEISNKRSFDSRTLILQNLGTAIEQARFLKEDILYSSQGGLYMNLDQINLINAASANDSTNEANLKINNIIINDSDFYLATNYGIFKNYKRIFTKEECFHLEKSSKKIFISCVNGIYHADFDPRNSYANYSWRLYESSPPAVNFFTLNRSKTNPEYASSINGFYNYDVRKNKWLKRNQNITRDFNESYGFGRFIVEYIDRANDRILLPTSLGLMVSNDSAKTWIRNNSGLKADPSGFYTIREIKKYHDSFLLATSTGLYITKDSDKSLQWQQVEINKLRKDQNLNDNIYSIDIKYSRARTKPDLITISNSEGQIIGLEESFNQAVINQVQEEVQEQVILIPEVHKFTAAIEKKEDFNLIQKILSYEPKVQELHQAAINSTGIPTGKKFNSYRKQARLRNLLPELSTSAGQGRQDYISIESTGKDSFSSSNSSISTSQDAVNINRNDNQIDKELSLNWNFANLIYDPVINEINTNARITANIRENVLNEITQIYFQRKELLYKLLKQRLIPGFAGVDLEIDYQDQLRFEEYTAQLDARTDSWFTNKLVINFKKLEKDFPELISSKIKELYFGTIN